MLHAVGVMITRELERSAFYRDRVPTLLKQAGVFLYVCFAWIFFRADVGLRRLAHRPPHRHGRLEQSRRSRR